MIPAFAPTLFMPTVVGGYDSATTAWAAQVVTNGGTVSTTQKGYVDTLIRGLKTDGVWTKLDALFLFASENTYQALLDLTLQRNATAVNSPTFTANRGYTGLSSSSAYLSANFVPSTAGGHYTTNSAHISVYDRTARTSGFTIEMGANDASLAEYSILQPYSSATATGALNASSTDTATVGVTNSQGFFIITRVSSTEVDLYRNGTLGGNNTGTAIAGPPASSLLILARNNNGSPAGYSNDQLAAASIGGSLTATDAANLSSRINAYMTSVGANVY